MSRGKFVLNPIFGVKHKKILAQRLVLMRKVNFREAYNIKKGGEK